MAPAKSNSPVADKIPSWAVKGPLYDKPGSDPISQQIKADQQAHNGRRDHAPFDLDDLDIPGGVPVGPIFNQNGQDVTGQFPSLDNIKQAIVKMLKNQKREQHHFNAATAPHHHVRGNDDVEFIDVSRRQVEQSTTAGHPCAHPGHHLQHATGANADMSRRQAAGGQHPTSEPPSSVKYPHPHSEHPEPHPHPHPEPQASSVKHITTDDNDESDTSSSFGHDDDDDDEDQEDDFREEMQDAIDDLSDEMNDVSNDLDHLDRRNDAAEESSKLAKSIEGLAKQMDKIDDDLEDLDRRDDAGMPGLAKSIQGLSQQMDEVDEMLKKKGKKGLGRPHEDDDDEEGDHDKHKKHDADEDEDDKYKKPRKGNNGDVQGDADDDDDEVQAKQARRAATATAVQAKRQVHTIMYSYSIPTPPPVPSVPAIPGQSSSSSAQKGKQSGGSKHKQQRRSPSSHPAQHPAAGGDSGLSLILHKKSPRTDSYQAPAAPTAPAAPAAPNAPKAPAVPAIPAYSAGKKRLYGLHRHAKDQSNIKCAGSSSSGAAQQQPGKRLYGLHKHKAQQAAGQGCPPPAAAAKKPKSKHDDDDDDDSDDEDDERHRGTPQKAAPHHKQHRRDDKAALSSPDIERLRRAYRSSRTPPASRRQDYQAIDLAFSASTPTTSSATASGYNSSTLGTNLSCLESLGLIVVVFAVLMSIVGWLGAKRAYYARRRQQARREHQAATAAAHAKAMVLGTADELGDETVVAAEVCLHAEDEDAHKDVVDADRSQRDGAAATEGSNGRAERQSLLLDSREQEEQQRYEVVAIAQLS